MDISSYLFLRKRKRINISSRKMDNRSSSDSNISLDSLENDFKKKTNRICGSPLEDNIDTILVPFYEKDVLIKVHKDSKKKSQNGNQSRKDSHSCSSYLIKRDDKKLRRKSYLDRFRKQFSLNSLENKNANCEIRSISPEYGDTERESFGDEDNNPTNEFYNTESYNELYYDKILNTELEDYMKDSFDEGLNLNDDRSQSPDEDNLKSISEVTQPRRLARRATVLPVHDVKLGGLGPDMEKIKPRLERARSLQRYSEKVRMENRLKIYKKSVQAELEKKAETDNSARRRHVSKEFIKHDRNASYLINNTTEEKISKKIKKIATKSATASATFRRHKVREPLNDDQYKMHADDKRAVQQQETTTNKKHHVKTNKTEKKELDDNNFRVTQSVMSSARSRGINTDKESLSNEVPPVQISFLVNVGGVRPSSALRTLEEKHRMYQEQVKTFTLNSNNI